MGSFRTSIVCSIAPTPQWLKKRIVATSDLYTTKTILKELDVDTVCESALCPNLNECFSRKFATFLILGDVCTRGCGFCSVERGVPSYADSDEAGKIFRAVRKLNLKHVVITSVTRDDLEDGGALKFANITKAIKEYSQGIKVELLIPDFNGSAASLMKVLAASPDIIGHNIETVKRLYTRVRRGADYERSLALLRFIKGIKPDQLTKSGLMVGLGEAESEIRETIRDIRGTGCDILTIGQYLRPRRVNLAVERFVAPDEFERYKRFAGAMGFKHVAAGPFVRSSNGGCYDKCNTAAVG